MDQRAQGNVSDERSSQFCNKVVNVSLIEEDEGDESIDEDPPLHSTRKQVQYNWNQLVQALHFRVCGDSLCLFRIMFGIVCYLQYHLWRNMDSELQNTSLASPYVYFEWAAAVTNFEALKWIMSIQPILSFCVTVGLFTRTATILSFVSIFFLFHQCSRFMNNHYIFILWICLLGSVIDWGQMYSVDLLINNIMKRKRKYLSPLIKRSVTKESSKHKNADERLIPFWHLFLMQILYIIPYFFGGIAKMQYDWLGRQQPIRYWFKDAGSQHQYTYFKRKFLTHPLTPYFMSWGGCAFDIVEPLLLMLSTMGGRFRILLLPGILGSLTFNLINKWILNIGVFPYAMIASLILFTPPGYCDNIFNLMIVGKIRSQTKTSCRNRVGTLSMKEHIAAVFVIVWLSIHLLWPLRGQFVSPSFVSWHEEGHIGSWNMKLREKEAFSIFEVHYVESDNDNNVTTVRFAPSYDPGINHNKLRLKFQAYPYDILHYVKYLHSLHEMAGYRVKKITAECCVCVNERPYQHMIMKDVNLLHWTDKYWIPFTTGVGKFIEPLRRLDEEVPNELKCDPEKLEDATRDSLIRKRYVKLFKKAGLSFRRNSSKKLENFRVQIGESRTIPSYYFFNRYNYYKNMRRKAINDTVNNVI